MVVFQPVKVAAEEEGVGGEEAVVAPASVPSLLSLARAALLSSGGAAASAGLPPQLRAQASGDAIDSSTPPQFPYIWRPRRPYRVHIPTANFVFGVNREPGA